MNEFLPAYGLFLAELATFVVLAAIIVTLIVVNRRGGQADGLTVEHLNRRYEDSAAAVKRVVFGKERFKKDAKARAKQHKLERRAQSKEETARPRLFVLDFKGDLRASATASLREEVSAVLAVAGEADRVLLRLENAGGMVHEHGLAASQLMRVKRHGLKLDVAVDKIAASGGYLMACIADHLIAAPFAIIGSIGVLAQLPNFHRWLEDKGIDFELLTAGRYKRTLTFFGKNTEEGRAKLQQELEDAHELFKSQIGEYRPQVDLERVATGEHWYGTQALALKLVDEIRTSDDVLIEAAKDHDLFRVAYRRRRSWPERLKAGSESLLSL